ncbi:sigma-54-dependent transcriptional regulator [Sediminibacterium sp.]|uniref:sigma-54-dependent transcriptional regulator n=1 Tax=Sediminibacterium sp. TaxID=1917865 RepID=UPI003F6E6326
MKPTKPLKIFILEDDLWYGTMLEHYLSLNPDYQVERFDSEKTFFQKLPEQPDVVTLDYSLAVGEADGSKILKKIKERYTDTAVIIISGQEEINTAVELLKLGAFDYIVKDEDTKDRLWNALQHLQEIKGLKKEVEELKNELKKTYDFSKVIIGQSIAIQRVYGLIDKASKTNITVSITGETGTGKEMVAKAIHYNSIRQKFPFVAINVAAIPPELLESELFGYEKGAFTGANARRIGKFEEAHKGTIFLDEIGEMDLHLQAKILRVLQEREITRIGGNQVIPLDIRIIVATNKNLLKGVEKKEFREDLYYRLLGMPIELPPLRERGNDFIILSKHFIQSFCAENRLPVKTLTPESIEKLKQYNFPGNIRELKSIIELAIVMSENNIIQPEDINIENISQLGNLLSTETSLKEYEKKIIQFFLKKYNNDVILVAKKLDIGKSTIYRMMQNGELIK